nr:MAG TPA: hypothetical protein [Caudoviricetes sp.]
MHKHNIVDLCILCGRLCCHFTQLPDGLIKQLAEIFQIY